MSSSGSTFAVIAALVGNFLIAGFKLAAALVSGSSSMLAEAYHSSSDTLNQIFLLIGIKRSKLPPTAKHPYGYGKAQFFYAFIVAMMLFAVAGVLSVREGYNRLFHPEPLEQVIWSFAALGFAFVVESFTLFFAFKEVAAIKKKENFKTWRETIIEAKDPTVLTVFFEDSLALIGLIIAALGIGLVLLTGNPIWDGIASLLIGVLLMVFAFMLARETKKLLVGEAVTKYKMKALRDAILSVDEVNEILDIKTMHLTPEQVIVHADVNIKDGLVTREIEHVLDRIKIKIKKILPKAICAIEVEQHHHKRK